MSQLRWGILGTGNIARQFAAGLAASAHGMLAAAASRQRPAAEAFARAFGSRAYEGYDRLLADPDVDVLYLSLPNSMHHEWTLRGLEAGKHVLCEKPLAMTEAQAREMFATAQRHRRVLIEGFMYVCQPQINAAQQLVHSGAIGALKLIRASFCFRTTKIDGNVRFDPDLGGGALMDVGCYCVNFARRFAGREPTGVEAIGRCHPRGVDEMAAGTLHFAPDLLATFQCGMGVQCDNAAYLCGEEGYIVIDWPWKPPDGRGTLTLARGIPPLQDGKPGAPPASGPPPREQRVYDAGMNLFAVEADAFARTVLEGSPPFVSADDSIGNARILERMRRQIGLNY